MHAARTVQMSSGKAAKDLLPGPKWKAADRNRPLLFQTGIMPMHPSLVMIAATTTNRVMGAPEDRSRYPTRPFFPPRSLKTHSSPLAHNRNHCAYLVRTFNPNTPKNHGSCC